MIRYLIIDDEPVAHQIIKGYCDAMPNMQLVKNCYDALEALEFLQNRQVDLIFLDINMPVLKGFEFLKILPHPPKVIVTTAYQEFALEGYTYNIADYLLKPFSFERFLQSIQKAMGTLPPQINTVQENKAGTNRIFVQSNKQYVQLETESILFIEATGNYTKIVSIPQTVTIREKFSAFLERLPKNEFLQVHKSFAVGPKHINSIEGNIIHIDKYQIPIGKMYKLNIIQLLK